MQKSIKLDLPTDLLEEIDAEAKKQGLTRGLYIQNRVEAALFREELMKARKILVPLARRAGFHTDEDIFKAIS